MHTKTINLPGHDVTIVVSPSADGGIGGSISGGDGLYEKCPECKQVECEWNCDVRASATTHDRVRYNGAIEGIMAMVLALACAGIDVESPAFLTALETALDGAANNT